jgi:hypothetical protein
MVSVPFKQLTNVKCLIYYLKKELTGLPVLRDSLRAIAIRCFCAVAFGKPCLLKHFPPGSHTLNPFPLLSIIYGIVYGKPI